MQFIIKTMTGDKIKITEDEYKMLLNASGLVAFPSCGVTVNTSRIESVYAENHPDVIEDSKDQTSGRLHDGTRVKRHFGEWVDADHMTVDDRGNYVPVRIDANYYPEVARDTIFTEEEYERIKHLPREERLKLVAGESKQRQTSGLTQIGKIF